MSFYFRPLVKTAILLVMCAAPLSSAAHTFHTSLMSMEYNSSEQLLEISLQVYTHDLENALTRRRGQHVLIDKTPDAPALILAYLQEAVNLKNSAGDVKPFAWVGMEAQSDRVLLYFEARMPEGITGALLRNRIFFDLLDDQINLVHLKQEDKKSDLVFKPGDGFKPLFAPTPTGN
ncbi:MAG TPA: DUF6702 family protein [Pyrinomonadaceae bacterium]|jgi:hypothetical protein|nr:DUF6702 family protein [Pyrinomonadaceae bacterium]